MPRTAAVAFVACLVLVVDALARGAPDAPRPPAPAEPSLPSSSPPGPASEPVARRASPIPEWCQLARLGRFKLGEIRTLQPGRFLVAVPHDDRDGSATGCRVVPSFRSGRSIGFKVFSIRPDSLFGRLGLENGDVVREINRHPLDEPEDALEVYSQVRQSRYLEVLVERRGALLLFGYCLV